MRLLVALCVLVFAACGGRDPGDIDEVIGAACTSDRNCAERCYLGGEFPDGFCSLPCRSDNDCPIDTYCMEVAGGVCMYACPAFDCARLGRDWECRDKRRKMGGDVAVCTGR